MLTYTYWEDLGPTFTYGLWENQYGGPFTTEQVEDVKPFISILGMILIASVLMSMQLKFPKIDFYTTYVTKLFGKHHTENRFTIAWQWQGFPY